MDVEGMNEDYGGIEDENAFDSGKEEYYDNDEYNDQNLGRQETATTNRRPSSASRFIARSPSNLSYKTKITQRGTEAIATARSMSNIPRSFRKREAGDDAIHVIDERLKLKKVPQNFYKDPEAMYMEIQELKSQIIKYQSEINILRASLQKTEVGQLKKQKQIEELLRAQAIVETKGQKYETLFKEVNLAKRLKIKIKEMEKLIVQKDEEINKMKLDTRYSRVRELETELKTYYAESKRLQKVIDQQMYLSSKTQVSVDEIIKLREKNTKFRDLLVKMKQMQDFLKEENDVLTGSLERAQQEVSVLKTTPNQPISHQYPPSDCPICSDKIKDLEDRINILQLDKQTSESIIKDLTSKQNESKNLIDSQHNAIEELKNHNKRLEKEVQDLRNVEITVDSYKQNSGSLANRLVDANSEIEQLKSTNNTLEKSVKNLMSQLTLCNTQLDNNEKEIRHLKEKLSLQFSPSFSRAPPQRQGSYNIVETQRSMDVDPYEQKTAKILTYSQEFDKKEDPLQDVGEEINEEGNFEVNNNVTSSITLPNTEEKDFYETLENTRYSNVEDDDYEENFE